MDELISRQEAIKDAESWVAVDEYEKHLKEIVIEWIKEFPPAKLSTNLASLGTDCISRQAAIDIAKDLTITVEGYEMHNQAVMNYCADIMQLPPIQPKRGRWIHHPEIGWGETWLCDQCGEKTTSTVMGKPRANFCPNCGAKMEVTT